MKNFNFSTAKGFAIGVVVTVLLAGTVAYANADMRQIFFGVNVSVNGTLQQFDDDSRPFIMDGRTFLPVGALGNVLGVQVGWNADTATVEIGHAGAPAEQPPAQEEPPAAAGESGPLLSVLPMDRISWERVTIGSHQVRNGQSFSIGARMFPNSIPNTLSHSNQGNVFHFDLNGEFSTLSGYVGAINDAGNANARRDAEARVRFFADGEQVGEYLFGYEDEATAVSFNVSGVTRFTVEFQGNIHGSGNIRPTFASPQLS